MIEAVPPSIRAARLLLALILCIAVFMIGAWELSFWSVFMFYLLTGLSLSSILLSYGNRWGMIIAWVVLPGVMLMFPIGTYVGGQIAVALLHRDTEAFFAGKWQPVPSTVHPLLQRPRRRGFLSGPRFFEPITVVTGWLIWMVSPIVVAMSAGFVGQLFGCRVDEGGSHPCVIGGMDIGSALNTMAVMGWLSLLSFPSGIVALFIYCTSGDRTRQ